MTRLFHVLAGLAVAMCAVGSARGQTTPAPTCEPAIAASEHAERLPPRILEAIGVVESGRLNPRTGVATPWPWTINVAGAGRVFDTAADAITAVQAAQAAGVQSIDVGCMQINLLHHPHAFATLQDAFDPDTNVRYAANFLSRLHGRTSGWGTAIAAYHSATPALGLPYARTVALIWPLAARFGLVAPDPAASTRAALATEIDPDDVLTPEFRARLVDAALQRRRSAPEQLDAMPQLARTGAASSRPAAPKGGRGAMQAGDRDALENEVDPQRVLTPAFRAQMVAAARAAHRNRFQGAEDVMPSGGERMSRHPGRSLPADGALLHERGEEPASDT